MAYVGKMKSGETVLLRFGMHKAYVKSEIETRRDGEDGIKLIIHADPEIDIDRNPKSGEARHWPDGGAANAAAHASKAESDRTKLQEQAKIDEAEHLREVEDAKARSEAVAEQANSEAKEEDENEKQDAQPKVEGANNAQPRTTRPLQRNQASEPQSRR